MEKFYFYTKYYNTNYLSKRKLNSYDGLTSTFVPFYKKQADTKTKIKTDTINFKPLYK